MLLRNKKSTEGNGTKYDPFFRALDNYASQLIKDGSMIARTYSGTNSLSNLADRFKSEVPEIKGQVNSGDYKGAEEILNKTKGTLDEYKNSTEVPQYQSILAQEIDRLNALKDELSKQK